MALTPSFTIGQNPLLPNIVVASDTSTGSDSAITQRWIFVQDSYGNYLVPTGTLTQYTVWDLADSNISLNILTTDIAVSVTVQWLDVDNTVLYTASNSGCLAQYNKLFLYYLVQQYSINPATPSDSNFDSNVSVFWAAILGGLNAVAINNDIAASQSCLDRANYMRLNQNLYF